MQMIVNRVWTVRNITGYITAAKEGWFLFGIFPLYIRDLDICGRRR